MRLFICNVGQISYNCVRKHFPFLRETNGICYIYKRTFSSLCSVRVTYGAPMKASKISLNLKPKPSIQFWSPKTYSSGSKPSVIEGVALKEARRLLGLAKDEKWRLTGTRLL